MRFFSGKKTRDAKKQQQQQQHIQEKTAHVDKVVKTQQSHYNHNAAPSQRKPALKQPGQQRYTHSPPPAAASIQQQYSLATVPEYPKKRAQVLSPSNNRSPHVQTKAPVLDRQYQQKKASQDTRHVQIKSVKTAHVTNSGDTRTESYPVAKPTRPQSILHHTHQVPATTQTNYTMDGEQPNNEAQPKTNRVHFLSCNSSVTSASSASEVHLMAGPGSVASSSAMSSSKDAENVFDRVLHSVMTEEEDRLKAMGMGGAPPPKALSPAMYYKTTQSSGMYFRGGHNRSVSQSSDEVSQSLSPRANKVPVNAAGQLIDMDTGMEISDLGRGVSSNVNDSTTTIDSDCALNGSMNVRGEF
eukprot:scaffold48828_cov75-Cyclotella_meneghiniana.AAC.2